LYDPDDRIPDGEGVAVPITRSDLLVFSAGLAAGALAYATYPKWKEKLGPMISGAMAGAGDPFDAISKSGQTMGEGVDSDFDPTTTTRQAAATNGTCTTAPSPA
jgi:hypothetical protein